MIRLRDVALALVGLGICAVVAGRIGATAVGREIVAVGIVLPIILVLSLVRLVLQSRSLSIALARDGIRFPANELMFVRLASQSIGYLTVLGPVASEPMKIRLLGNDERSAAAATLVDSGVYWLSSALVGLAGCLAAGILLAHSGRSVISVVILAAVFAGTLFLIVRGRALLAPLVTALGDRSPGWLKKGEQIEVVVRSFAGRHPSSIRPMFLLSLGCQALLAVEVVAVFWCLGLSVDGRTVLALEAASRMVKMATAWIPSRLGADVSGAAGAFAAFGLPAASGFALALARRTRDLLWALVGLTWLVWQKQRPLQPAEQGGIPCKL